MKQRINEQRNREKNEKKKRKNENQPRLVYRTVKTNIVQMIEERSIVCHKKVRIETPRRKLEREIHKKGMHYKIHNMPFAWFFTEDKRNLTAFYGKHEMHFHEEFSRNSG